MSIASAYLTVAGINVDVVYKDIKHLHIGVYPPVGRVRVAAPRRLDDDQVRLALVKRLPWIRAQRDRLQRAERQSQREMAPGESHYVWGSRYRLRLVERAGRSHVEIDGDRLVLYVSEGTSMSGAANCSTAGTAHASAKLSRMSSPSGNRGSACRCPAGRSAA